MQKSGQLSNTTENYYKNNLPSMLPSTNSIEVPGKGNLASSMMQFRKISDDTVGNSGRGRKVIGSERFNLKGNREEMPSYKANPMSPFRRAKNGISMKPNLTSTSLNKYSFKRNAQIQLGESSNISKSGIVSDVISQEIMKPSRGPFMNTVSMKELSDLDSSPEKR